jgi:hypothetical protein
VEGEREEKKRGRKERGKCEREKESACSQAKSASASAVSTRGLDSHGCEGGHGAEDGGRDVPRGGGGEYTIWQMARHGKVQDLMAYFDSLGNDINADVRDTYGNTYFTTHATD